MKPFRGVPGNKMHEKESSVELAVAVTSPRGRKGGG